MGEGTQREFAAQVVTDPPVLAEAFEDAPIVGRIGDDGDAGVVLRRGADQGRAADVDLLDQLVGRHVRAARRLRERVEIDHDQLERFDAGHGEAATVIVAAQIGQDARRDPRMERLHPTVEHLREAGHGSDIDHVKAGFAQRPRRAAGRDDLETEVRESPAKLDQPGLVRHRDERAARGRDGRRDPRIDPDLPAFDADRAGQGQGDAPRQQPVLDGVDARGEAVEGVAGHDLDHLLGHDRATVERLVDEMDGHAGHPNAGHERIADGIAAGEGGQE